MAEEPRREHWCIVREAVNVHLQEALKVGREAEDAVSSLHVGGGGRVHHSARETLSTEQESEYE